jgi:hypothetical protein
MWQNSNTGERHENYAHPEIRFSIKLENPHYHCALILFSSLIPKNETIKIYRAFILPLALHGCKTSYFILRE